MTTLTADEWKVPTMKAEITTYGGETLPSGTRTVLHTTLHVDGEYVADCHGSAERAALLKAIADQLNAAEQRLAEGWLPPDEAEKLRVEIVSLRAKLNQVAADAAEEIQHWGAYASEYFQEKWDLRGDIDRFTRIAVEALDAQPTDKITEEGHQA